MSSREHNELLAGLLGTGDGQSGSYYEVLEDWHYDKPLPPSWTEPLVGPGSAP